MKAKLVAALLLGAAFVAPQAQALPVTTDLTPADYITIGSLDWAWASPVDDQGNTWFSGFVLEGPAFHFGWRYATELEWLTHPDVTDFAAQGYPCASKYWNNTYEHCDFGDTLVQYSTNDGIPYDILYVRGALSEPELPAPGGLALLGFGLLGLGALRRKLSP